MVHDYDFTTLEDLFYGYMVLYGDENVKYGLIMIVDQTRMQAGCDFFGVGGDLACKSIIIMLGISVRSSPPTMPFG